MKKYTAEDALPSAVYLYLKIISFLAVSFTRLVAIHLLFPTKLSRLLWGFHQCRVFFKFCGWFYLRGTYRSILADGAFNSGITKSEVSYFCCAFSKSRTAFADREVGLVREGKDRDKRLRLFRCMRFRFECCFSIWILNKKKKSDPSTMETMFGLFEFGLSDWTWTSDLYPPQAVKQRFWRDYRCFFVCKRCFRGISWAQFPRSSVLKVVGYVVKIRH